MNSSNSLPCLVNFLNYTSTITAIFMKAIEFNEARFCWGLLRVLDLGRRNPHPEAWLAETSVLYIKTNRFIGRPRAKWPRSALVRFIERETIQARSKSGRVSSKMDALVSSPIHMGAQIGSSHATRGYQNQKCTITRSRHLFNHL